MRPIDRHHPPLHEDRACVFCGGAGDLEHTAMLAMCGDCCAEGVDGQIANARTPLDWWRVIRRVRSRRPLRCKYCHAPNVPDDLRCVAMCDACCDERVDGQLAEARTPLGRFVVVRRVRRRHRRS
jgi:hypothetical protein